VRIIPWHQVSSSDGVADFVISGFGGRQNKGGGTGWWRILTGKISKTSTLLAKR
jgi:hypothetical protein